MKKNLVRLFFVLMCIPALTTAQLLSSKMITEEMRIRSECKERALSRKEKMLSDSRKEYVKESGKITSEAKIGLEIVKWRIFSSFRVESKKILDEQRSKLNTLSLKINREKASAFATWKAEDSLCDIAYEKALKALGGNAKK